MYSCNINLTVLLPLLCVTVLCKCCTNMLLKAAQAEILKWSVWTRIAKF